MANFKLNLYTPSGVIVRGLECNDILIPTVRGEINILPEHTHFLTQLDTGILTAKNKDVVNKFSVTAGVCKILKDEITILSYTSEAYEKIDLDRAESALKRAEIKLSEEAMDAEEQLKYQRKLARAKMRIELVKSHMKKH
jgi:F-type H+-transporting ATPase subunit epsilon